mmetsp:Transcript_177824/g.570280  ORF Transcript_177824/g.570280 Transcript_177824/m.570280 type:complete len:203 (+) Transcript_177824:106-714(+)
MPLCLSSARSYRRLACVFLFFTARSSVSAFSSAWVPLRRWTTTGIPRPRRSPFSPLRNMYSKGRRRHPPASPSQGCSTPSGVLGNATRFGRSGKSNSSGKSRRCSTSGPDDRRLRQTAYSPLACRPRLCKPDTPKLQTASAGPRARAVGRRPPAGVQHRGSDLAELHLRQPRCPRRRRQARGGRARGAAAKGAARSLRRTSG